jgi:hydroxymethylbilane synthase
LFTKELDNALIDERIDLAVHSAKDLPTQLPDAISIAGYLAREDPRDVLIARGATSLAELPQGAVVGSASLRREALVRRLRPDLHVVLLRGNVETRLRRVEAGEIDATLLALAGLERLGLAARASAILDVKMFPPAVGQGALAITVRAGNRVTPAMLAPILDEDTGAALACERAFLHVLDGSCRTPIAGHARPASGTLQFHGLVLRRDGTEAQEVMASAPVAEAAACGAAAGRDLLQRLPAGFFAS